MLFVIHKALKIPLFLTIGYADEIGCDSLWFEQKKSDMDETQGRCAEFHFHQDGKK